MQSDPRGRKISVYLKYSLASENYSQLIMGILVPLKN